MVAKEKVCLPYNNRAFRYGDSFFETMRVINGRIPLLEAHLQRARRTAAILSIRLPEWWNHKHFPKNVQALLEANGTGEQARLRVQCYRQGAGRYTPSTDKAGILMEAEPLQEDHFPLHSAGITTGIFDAVQKERNALANLKTGNALVYVLAARYAQQQGWPQALVTNTTDNIISGTYANLFVVHDGRVLTPPLDEGPVAGVMRQTIIDLLNEHQEPLKEQALTRQNLQIADEIWLTNAVRGIEWVAGFEGQPKTNTLAKKVNGWLNR